MFRTCGRWAIRPRCPRSCGGPYVGYHRAGQRLYLSGARVRSSCRANGCSSPDPGFLREIQPELIDWRRNGSCARFRAPVSGAAIRHARPSQSRSAAEESRGWCWSRAIGVTHRQTPRSREEVSGVGESWPCRSSTSAATGG